MNTRTMLPGTFPNTSITVERNDAALPVAYNLLKDGDEQASLPVQVGSPENITGFTTEDIITIAIHRLELLNSAYQSPLNTAAIKALKEANTALKDRFTITSNKLEIDSVPNYVVQTVSCGDKDLRLAIYKGFLFAGYNYGELAKNINTAKIASYKDFKDTTVAVVLETTPFYISREGKIVNFKGLSARGAK